MSIQEKTDVEPNQKEVEKIKYIYSKNPSQ